jgi:hypothetical protein
MARMLRAEAHGLIARDVDKWSTFSPSPLACSLLWRSKTRFPYALSAGRCVETPQQRSSGFAEGRAWTR